MIPQKRLIPLNLFPISNITEFWGLHHRKIWHESAHAHTKSSLFLRLCYCFDWIIFFVFWTGENEPIILHDWNSCVRYSIIFFMGISNEFLFPLVSFIYVICVLYFNLTHLQFQYKYFDILFDQYSLVWLFFILMVSFFWHRMSLAWQVLFKNILV